MKAKIIEHRGCFEISMTAESMEDAVQITRIGMGATKELRECWAYVGENQSPFASVVLGKYKNMSSEVKRSAR